MPVFAHFVFTTAFGHAGLVYQSDPFLLEKICLPCATPEALRRNAQPSDWGEHRSHPLADQVAEMICDYFIGKRLVPPWEWLDFARFSPAQAKVYTQVARIPYGQVRTYGQIALAADHPRAARFVGRCMAGNPYPILIPCHRVVCSDGSLGGFGGGTALKQRMLDLEAMSH